MGVKYVNISMQRGQIKVSPPVVKPSKLNRDTIEWRARPATSPFLVCLGDRSPFLRRHFSTGRAASGQIRASIPVGSIFKYSVEFQGKVLDPGMIIDR